MKLKRSNKPVLWRSRYMHHNDAGVKDFRFGWRRPSDHGNEELKAFGKVVVLSRYAKGVQESFEQAVKRCPTVVINHDIMEGQPCVVGTRIPVRAVLRALEQYGSIEGVRTCYPHLTKSQVEDALYFCQIILEPPGGLDETSTAT